MGIGQKDEKKIPSDGVANLNSPSLSLFITSKADTADDFSVEFWTRP